MVKVLSCLINKWEREWIPSGKKLSLFHTFYQISNFSLAVHTSPLPPFMVGFYDRIYRPRFPAKARAQTLTNPRLKHFWWEINQKRGKKFSRYIFYIYIWFPSNGPNSICLRTLIAIGIIASFDLWPKRFPFFSILRYRHCHMSVWLFEIGDV